MLERKRKKWPIILFLVLLVLGIGTYFGIQYNLKKTSSKEEKEEVKEERIPLSNAQQEYLLSKISFYDGMLPYGTMDAKTLDQTKALQFVDSIRNVEYVDFTKGVSLTKIKNILTRYFGKNVFFDETQSTCQDPNVCFFYQPEEKKYIKNTLSNYPIQSKSFYVEGTQGVDTKDIIIKVRMLYYHRDASQETVTRYFGTAESLEQNQAPIFDLEALYGSKIHDQTTYQLYLNQAYQSIANQLPIMTYHFFYQSGGYYLESVVK